MTHPTPARWRATHGSLFTGVAGIDLGFERAGIETLWQCEIDRDANRVLAHHFPHVDRHLDVREVGAHNLATVDVISFGSPCQGFSVAGRRGGMTDERSGLFSEAVRIVGEVRPALALWEAVPGTLSSAQGRDFGAALDALADIGAVDICWRCLDSQFLGVAQRRRRVFLVASFRAGISCHQILFEPASGSGDHQARSPSWEDLAVPIAGGSYGTGRRSEDDPNLVIAGTLTSHHGRNESHGTYVAHSLTTRHGVTEDGTGRGTPLVAHTLRAEGHDASEDGTGRGVPLVFDEKQITSAANRARVAPGLPSPTLNGGGEMTIAWTERTRHDGANVESQEELAYALTNPGAGGRTDENRIARGMSVRRLTPKECTRLMSLPDDWLDIPSLSDSAKYRLLGNSVVVNVAAWIGARIAAAMGAAS